MQSTHKVKLSGTNALKMNFINMEVVVLLVDSHLRKVWFRPSSHHYAGIWNMVYVMTSGCFSLMFMHYMDMVTADHIVIKLI